jgi:hypothetical protein
MEIRVSGGAAASRMKLHVEKALKWMPSVDLRGLKQIVLLDADFRFKPSKELPFFIANNTATGFYISDFENAGPTIFLSAEDLFLGLPWFLKYTPLSTLRVAETLAHEIAHHQQFSVGFVFSPEERIVGTKKMQNQSNESIAELYSHKIMKKMRRQLRYSLAAKVEIILSWFYYQIGIGYGRKFDFCRAAYYFLCSYRSNRHHVEASKSYAYVIRQYFKKVGDSQNSMGQKEAQTQK